MVLWRVAGSDSTYLVTNITCPSDYAAPAATRELMRVGCAANRG